MNPVNTQRGNALFLILIAVALFAALSYAVTQSGRGSGTASREQEVLQVAQIMTYAGSIEQAINRLLLVNGCIVGTGTVNNNDFTGTLAFDSSSWTFPARYDNVDAPADKSCHIFDPAGGGIVWQPPPSIVRGLGVSEYMITGERRIVGVGPGTTGASENHEALFLSWVTRTMCLYINDRAGITNPGGEPPESPNAGYAIPPPGQYAIGDGYVTGGGDLGSAGEALEVAGHTTGCYFSDESGTDRYYFFHAVVAR